MSSSEMYLLERESEENYLIPERREQDELNTLYMRDMTPVLLAEEITITNQS